MPMAVMIQCFKCCDWQKLGHLCWSGEEVTAKLRPEGWVAVNEAGGGRDTCKGLDVRS